MSIDTNAQAMFDALRATAGNEAMKTPRMQTSVRRPSSSRPYS